MTKEFKCVLCDYSSDYKCSLKVHFKCIHDIIKDIQCSQCDAKFSSNGSMKYHIKSIHKLIKLKVYVVVNAMLSFSKDVF
jgi:hypothetical protein